MDDVVRELQEKSFWERVEWAFRNTFTAVAVAAWLLYRLRRPVVYVLVWCSVVVGVSWAAANAYPKMYWGGDFCPAANVSCPGAPLGLAVTVVGVAAAVAYAVSESNRL